MTTTPIKDAAPLAGGAGVERTINTHTITYASKPLNPTTLALSASGSAGAPEGGAA